MKSKNEIKYSFIAMIFIVFALGFFCESAVAVTNETDIYFKIESFTWKEYEDGGSQLLKESGPIYGLGASTKLDIIKSLTLKFKSELFGESIEYDGQTWAGTPVKTYTDYFGFKVEGDIGRIFMMTEKSSLEPFAGLGYRWWLRDIQNSSNSIGYEETWWSSYARLGIRSNHIFSDQLNAFAEAGVKFPMNTENEADLSVLGFSTVTLEPGNETSFFAEAGLKREKLKFSIFYEGMRFSKSSLDNNYNAFYQPESKADIFGVNIGIVFK